MLWYVVLSVVLQVIMSIINLGVNLIDRAVRSGLEPLTIQHVMDRSWSENINLQRLDYDN